MTDAILFGEVEVLSLNDRPNYIVVELRIIGHPESKEYHEGDNDIEAEDVEETAVIASQVLQLVVAIDHLPNLVVDGLTVNLKESDG